jgi:hypothetical protein
MRTPAAVLLLSFPLMAGSPLRTGAQRLFVPDGKLTLRVSRSVHFGDGTTGVDPREKAAGVHAAVFQAARAWSATGKAAVTVEVEFSSNTIAALDGSNTVTFNDPAPFDSGVCDKATYVACTLISYVAGTGEIRAVSIAFNPYLRHSAIGLGRSHDIGAVMMHEIGHALGLDHSAVMDSVMAPFVELIAGEPDGRFAPRRLAPDDVYTLAESYPHPEQEGTLARIQGSLAVDGAPAAGAHVVAISSSGRAVRGALTDDDGRWSMALDPGDYRLVAEPLDGPVSGASFTQPKPTSPSFATAFWSAGAAGPREGDPVTLAPGEMRGDFAFDLPSAEPSNLETVGLVESGLYVGHGRVVVARGGEYMLGWTRSPVEGTPAIDITLPGIVLDGEPRVASRTPQLVRQKVLAPGDAATGAYNVVYRDEKGSSLLAGAFIVVMSPVVESLADATTTERLEAVRPGQLILVEGREFGIEETVVDQINPEIAWPSQAGGLSVRIGDRYAPVRYVSPNAIIVEMPEGVAAGEAELTVITGPSTHSAPVALKLAVQ